MTKEDNLIPLTNRPFEEAQAIRRKGGKAKSQKKTNAVRLNPVTHGKYVRVPENKDKPLFQLKLEQAYSKHGVSNPSEIRRHILESLAMLTEAIGKDSSVSNLAGYVKLLMDIQEKLFSVDKARSMDLNDTFRIIIGVLNKHELFEVIDEIQEELEQWEKTKK